MDQLVDAPDFRKKVTASHLIENYYLHIKIKHYLLYKIGHSKHSQNYPDIISPSLSTKILS